MLLKTFISIQILSFVILYVFIVFLSFYKFSPCHCVITEHLPYNPLCPSVMFLLLMNVVILVFIIFRVVKMCCNCVLYCERTQYNHSIQQEDHKQNPVEHHKQDSVVYHKQIPAVLHNKQG